MKRVALWVFGVLTGSRLIAAEPVFAQDFSQVEIGAMPDDFLVLDGQFGVKEEGGNRFVELPGAPLESFGFLFGPNEAQGVEVTGRIYGSKVGRKFPTFSLGLNGSSGYRLQVAPAKGMLELVRGDTVVASTPFTWKSAAWTELRLLVRKLADNEYRIEGRAWTDGAEAPKDAQITFTDNKLQPSGKASAWGMPFSGTPLRFDDLKVTRLGGTN